MDKEKKKRVDNRPLTHKQEAFAQKYVELGDATAAYRFAYDASNMKPESVWRKAAEVMAVGKVAARIAELRSEVSKQASARFGITIESLLRELEEARQLSIDTGKTNAAVSAVMGKAKLCGFDVQKVDHTSSDGTMSPARSKLDDFYD